MIKQYFHKEDMWIEELLEHDRPISISIHFWKQIPLGLSDPAPVLQGLINILAKYLYVVFLVRPIIYLISSIDLLSKTTYIYTLNKFYMSSGSWDIVKFVFLGGHFENPKRRHTGICTNVNIDCRIPDAISFPKMCYIANLHKIWTKTLWLT